MWVVKSSEHRKLYKRNGFGLASDGKVLIERTPSLEPAYRQTIPATLIHFPHILVLTKDQLCSVNFLHLLYCITCFSIHDIYIYLYTTGHSCILIVVPELNTNNNVHEKLKSYRNFKVERSTSFYCAQCISSSNKRNLLL